jgi:hypothetical protein
VGGADEEAVNASSRDPEPAMRFGRSAGTAIPVSPSNVHKPAVPLNAVPQ